MTGTWLLLRTFLRRDRWQFLCWSLGGALLYWSQAYSVDGLYTTQADFDRAAATMESNLAFIAMIGPARALNTIGGQVTWPSPTPSRWAWASPCAGGCSPAPPWWRRR